MHSTPTAMTGLNVKAEMARKNISQAAVGACLDLSQPAVSMRLNGNTPFNINELAKIAALLDVPLERLTEGVAA